MILNDPIIMILKAPIHYVVNLGRQKWILNVFFRFEQRELAHQFPAALGSYWETLGWRSIRS